MRRLKELSRYVDGSPEKASLLGLIDILERRIAADNGLLEFAVRQTPGLVRWQALGNGNCLFFSMSLNVLSLTGKNWDPYVLRNDVVSVLESVPDENPLALSCHEAAANIADDRQYEQIDELTMMGLAITTNVSTTVFIETPGDGHATYTYTPEASARKFGLPFQMQPFGQVFLSNRSSAAPFHFDPLIHEENDGGVSAAKEETRKKEAEKAAAMEEEARQKEAALVEAASGARKRKQQEQLANKRLVETAERRRLKAQCLEDKERPAGKAQRAAALVLASTNPTKSMIEDPAMDAFEQDPTAALAHVCLTTGIHVPGLNNLRRLSNGTCPEEGEQVAIDEAEKTLEALTASVSRAASHAADAYVKCCHPTEKLVSCASCGVRRAELQGEYKSLPLRSFSLLGYDGLHLPDIERRDRIRTTAEEV